MLSACDEPTAVIEQPTEATETVDDVPEVPEIPSERPDIQGNMHRIEANGNTAYIFGSMHYGRPNWYPLNSEVESAMRRADIFVFETDLAEMESPEALSAAVEHMFLPDDMTLADFLPEDIYLEFVANIATFETVSYEMVSTMTPMTISFLTGAEVVVLQDLDSTYGVDFYIMNFAEENNKPIMGLNDAATEFYLVLNAPDDVQIATAAAFTDRATAIQAVDDIQLVDIYEANDMEGFFELRLAMHGDDLLSQFALERQVHARCRIFADEIARLLNETEEPTTFFITVGMLHVTGGDVDTNVLSLLRDKGFDTVSVFE